MMTRDQALEAAEKAAQSARAWLLEAPPLAGETVLDVVPKAQADLDDDLKPMDTFHPTVELKWLARIDDARWYGNWVALPAMDVDDAMMQGCMERIQDQVERARRSHQMEQT